MSRDATASKTLLQLAWPLIISFTARSLLTSVDIPYGSLIGDAAVAAIGLFFPLEFCFIACWVGASAALTSHLSRAMGEKHDGRIGQLVKVATWIVVFLMLLFLALAGVVYLVSEHLGLKPDVAANFKLYAPIAMGGIALFAFWSIVPDSIIKAHHDTKSTMIAGLISGVLNLALNTLFVIGFKWGIVGIGLATGLARLGSLLYALYRARRLERDRRRRWAEEPPPKPIPGRRPTFDATGLFTRPLGALLSLAIPSALVYVLMATEGFLVNFVLSRFEDSTAAIAAYAIYHRAVIIVLMPIIAVGVAVLPFVARLIGERRPEDVQRQLYQAFRLAAAYVLVVALPICLASAEPIARFLGKAEATQELAGFAIRYGTPIGALVSIPFLLCRPAFEALQRGAPGLIMASLRYLICSVPLALLGAKVAERAGHEPFIGLIAGLLLGTAVVSVVFTVWLTRTLRSLGD